MSIRQLDERSAQLLEELRARLESKPIAKAKPLSLREAHVCKSHAAFAEAIETMLLAGDTKRGIAREMDIDVHTLIDVYEGKRRLQAWMIAALPTRGRAVFLSRAIEWRDEERSGTDG